VLFGGWAFTFFGCNSLATSSFEMLLQLNVTDEPSHEAELGIDILRSVFMAMLLVISFRISVYHIPLVGSILIAIILESIGIYYQGWNIASGTFYSIGGILAMWLSFTQVFNEYWRSNVLPWWPYIHEKDINKKGSAHPYFPKVDNHMGHANKSGYTHYPKKKKR